MIVRILSRFVIFALPLFVLMAISPALFAASTDLLVKIDSGTVEGKQEAAIRTFLGIPYAVPPVGDLRWKPPAPAAKWNGVRSHWRCLLAKPREYREN